MTKQEQQHRFEDWLNEHGKILHHVANGFAAGHDRHDLMQELLLAVWKSIPAFRGGSKASTFIYRVSHNAALAWKRTRSNYQRKIEAFEAEFPDGTSDSPRPADAEMLERIYAHIRELPPLDRSLLLLSLDGISYRDMAEIHGLSETNIGVRLNRLKQKLVESLKGLAYELR